MTNTTPRQGSAGSRSATSSLRQIGSGSADAILQIWRSSRAQLDGQYTLHRLVAFHEYATDGRRRAAMLHLASIIPCLLVSTAYDVLPLRPPTLGPSINYWIRTTVGTIAFTLAFLVQAKHYIPGVELSRRAITLTALGWLAYRDQIRENASLRLHLQRFPFILNSQVSLTLVYPAYAFVFARLEPYGQTILSILLPFLKTSIKYLFGYAGRHLQDSRPGLIVFNVDVFSTLFVSSCLQQSKSPYAILAIVITDFIHACWSVKTIDKMLEDPHIQQILDRVQQPSLIPLVLHLAQHDQAVKRSVHFRSSSTMVDSWTTHSSGARRHSFGALFVKKLSIDGVNAHGGALFPGASVHPCPLQDSDLHHVRRLLSTEEKIQLVRHALRVLHKTELVSLVEYTEVVTPFIYSVFSVVTFYLRNHEYYRHLEGSNTSKQFWSNCGQLLLYSSMELISYVWMNMIMKRRLGGLSAFAQTAFVLETQWQMVQASLILWITLALQYSLLHYGADFTFQFAWLHNK